MKIEIRGKSMGEGLMAWPPLLFMVSIYYFTSDIFRRTRASWPISADLTYIAKGLCISGQKGQAEEI